jgi:hypothetical protein
MTFKKGHPSYQRKLPGLPPQAAGIVTQLAALMYYDDNRTSVASFESLDKDVVDKYTDRAAGVLIMLDKLNKRVIDKKEVEQAKEKESQYYEKLTQIIRSFVLNLNVLKPDLFPCEELAHKILEGGK